MKKAIKSSKIYTKNTIFDGYIVIEGKKIIDICHSLSDDISHVEDYHDSMIIPGIIDIHNHGYGGYSVTDEINYDQIQGYSRALASVGVTSVLATAKFEAFANIAKVIKQRQFAGTKILGIHSEGPFWARGGENTVGETWPAPDVELTKKYIDEADGTLKMMAIAPELPNAYDVMKLLHQKGIKVAACHTKASADQIIKANQEIGIDDVTHLCNGMNGIHHRNMGALGGFLELTNVYYELICDLNHVCKEMIEILLKILPFNKIMLISDSNYIAGLPCGVYERYGREMTLHANGLIKDNNGRICGSGKPVLYDMKQLVTKLGLPLQQVIRFASANPAAFLGISEETGDISINKLADIVVINEDFEVQATYIEGNKKYTLGDDVIGKEALKRKLR